MKNRRAWKMSRGYQKQIMMIRPDTYRCIRYYFHSSVLSSSRIAISPVPRYPVSRSTLLSPISTSLASTIYTNYKSSVPATDRVHRSICYDLRGWNIVLRHTRQYKFFVSPFVFLVVIPIASLCLRSTLILVGVRTDIEQNTSLCRPSALQTIGG